MPDDTMARTPTPAIAHPGASFLTNTAAITLPDGRTLQTYTAGSGEDVVVLESGLGQGAAYWGLVVDVFVSSAAPAKVVAYDRAGYGGSSRVNDRRDMDALADDLIALLSAQGGNGRIVLVGHSWGGPILRVAARKILASSPALATRLAGLVLVDPSDELCPFYFTRKLSWAFWLQSYLITPFYYLGKQPAITRAILDPLPDPYMAAAVAGCTANAAHATAWEIADFPRKLKWVGGGGRADVGQTPVTVVSAGKGEEMGAEFRDQLNAAHRRRAESCARGKFVVAEKSGHGINITEPELIVEEAMALLAMKGGD